ncbi:YdeI family protein [Flagellimonas halotolerans]|uniref:YdeI family protein n=1 Tax=Flagellimonas halotolerans TaxID=3112164 RepID=A0ABU6IMT1_9FLAO|nr:MULTISPECIES: YdeI family protein [unclassified Allomuricauda]MEC3964534.1 YdeI family protein [Muricauda sp. SYSU M86414]MEC4264403.1 YdeI family protein [Muricauda sp. SYSU M84420]
MNPKVDFFFEKTSQWQEAYRQLRKIVLDTGLTEALKWGVPCYTFQGSNVVLIHGFKEYCALLFHKGVLLKDIEGILIQQTKNVQSARQIRFTNVKEILNMEKLLKIYIHEAIEVEKAGLEVKMKKTTEFDMPEELQNKLDTDTDFKTAFEALTPGRQRGYMLYVSQAKQSKTRVSRVEKSIPKIFEGKGYNEM